MEVGVDEEGWRLQWKRLGSVCGWLGCRKLVVIGCICIPSRRLDAASGYFCGGWRLHLYPLAAVRRCVCKAIIPIQRGLPVASHLLTPSRCSHPYYPLPPFRARSDEESFIKQFIAEAEGDKNPQRQV